MIGYGLDTAQVDVNQWATGEIDIQIFGVTEKQMNELQQVLGKNATTFAETTFLSCNRARDKTRVTFFLG